MLQDHAEKAGVTAEEWKKFIAYVGGFYGNMSNYHSFGDMKFIPDLSPEAFEKILKSNWLYKEAGEYTHYLDLLWP